jgi:1-acyl-sn-glycerol-3-phosphate acyltransferase
MTKKIRDFITVFVSIMLYVFMLPSRFFRKIIILDKKVLKIDSPIVFVSNHKSIFDPWVISSSLPFSFFIKHIPVKILASTKKFGNNSFLYALKNFKLLDLIYFLYQCIPIKEADNPEEKLEFLQGEIDKGYSVLFFPEGGIKKDVEIGDIKQGVSILRRNNPNLPFVFIFVKYEKTFLPFYRKSSFVLSGPYFDQSENYQEFTNKILNNLSKVI